MQIIPVIDLKGGRVVHATGGDRSNYPVLKSVITQHSDVIGVITDLRDQFAFDCFYLADLDAIEQQKDNQALYQEIVSVFPDVTFWLDAGLSDMQQLEPFTVWPNVWPVIGSETLQSGKSLAPWAAKRYLLSLDFRYGELIGDPALLTNTQAWPKNVIVMNLDAVGAAQGPGIAQLAMLQQQTKHAGLIAAGGVRDQCDLQALQAIGIQRVLVATALHDGRLKPSIQKSR